MTDTIDFPITLDPHPLTTLRQPFGKHAAMRFTILDSVDDLPAEEGLYVLMGQGADRNTRPLCFGYSQNLAKQLPQSSDFASALRMGLTFVAVARPPASADPARLAETLGEVNGAPINTVRTALRDIDAARLPLPGAAEGGNSLAAE